MPEDRGKPDGRKIKIFAAVLPANTLSPKDDPLLILAGGPGQAASHARAVRVAADRSPPHARRRAHRPARHRPLVAADVRGIQAARRRSVRDGPAAARARSASQQLRAQGVDAAQYTTTAWIADLEAMRDALGYARWNLWGGSYGTRVAQEYLRRHPERVRTMTLDGVAPPAMIITLDVWRTREAALDAIFARLRGESPACSEGAPGSRGHARADRAVAGPGRARRRRRRSRAPASRARVHVTFDVVLGALQPLTYAPEIVEPAAGNAGARRARATSARCFAATRSFTEQPRRADERRAALSRSRARRTCRASRRTCERDALAGLPTRDIADNVIAVCDVWPRGTVPADFAQPVASDKPVLLFSGGMDPVTPPAYGDAVAKTLSNSRHIVARRLRPHRVAARVRAAPHRARSSTRPDSPSCRRSCIAYFEKSAPPPLWPDRLEPQP